MSYTNQSFEWDRLNLTMPSQFTPLLNRSKLEQHLSKLQLQNTCNCYEEPQALKDCPHLKNAQLMKLFTDLPFKLAFLDANDPENKDEIREHLFVELVSEFDKHMCEHSDSLQNDSESKPLTSQRSCHVYKDLELLFPDIYHSYEKLKNKQKRVKEAKYLVIGSFSLVILLLFLKIIALMQSNSMALLTSFMDNLLDCLSGIILLMSSFIAKKGIQKGEYQQNIHQQSISKKFIYSNRFENLGVLVFAVMMGTISAILIKESVEEVIKISKHDDEAMKFDNFATGVFIFNIVAKFILCVWCWIAAKRSDEMVETLKAYRDDHRNDTISNLVGLVGAVLSSKLGGDMRYCDPIAAILLCIYILVNWSVTALEQIQSFSGKIITQKQIDQLVIEMLCCFEYEPAQIKEIKSFHCYESGENIIIEVIIKTEGSVTDGHSICQSLQDQFEKVKGIERCFVHIE